MVTIKNKPSGTILSSSLSELIIESNNDYFEISLRTTVDGVPMFLEKIWTYNGSATVYNLNEIIENYMREKGISILAIQIAVASFGEHDMTDVRVLYCENYDVAEANIVSFASENFLTTFTSRRISPDFDFSLYFCSDKTATEAFEIKILFREKNKDVISSFITHGYPSSINSEIDFVSFNLNLLKGWIRSGLRITDFEIESFSISCGARYAVFFVDKSLQFGETFMFRNVFNAIDWITLPALTNSKTDVERSVAVLPGKSAFYDRTVTKSYEVQTGPLNHDEAEFLEQLAGAHETYRYIPLGLKNGIQQYAVKEILITDSDISYSDSDEPQSVKFTWRYADNRPPVILSDPTRIFTKEYNKVFS